MGLYDFKVGGNQIPARAAAWASLEDSPPITCRQCFNVYFAWEWKTTGDSRVGVWSKTDAWCRASGVQVQGGVDTPRRCINSDPTPANGDRKA